MIPTQQDVLRAYERVKPWVHRTPVMSSSYLNEISGASLFFKCENFQKMGAFKMRGAVNAIQNLSDLQKSRGVVTHSSGNFGQAVALAAQKLGITAFIVMPENAPKVKIEAVKNYGGHVLLCPSTMKDREETSQQVIQEKGAAFLHPSNDMDVILGNATATLELLEDHPDLEIMITPVGGGGLLAGTALAAHYFGKECLVFGGEPVQVNDAYRSLLSGRIETNDTSETIADGLRTNLGDKNFPIIKSWVKEIICVSELEIVAAMCLVWERMKIIIEPSSAVPLAAVLKEKNKFKNRKVGILVSGGNTDLSNLPF